jgi:hypothetical protein
VEAEVTRRYIRIAIAGAVASIHMIIMIVLLAVIITDQTAGIPAEAGTNVSWVGMIPPRDA